MKLKKFVSAALAAVMIASNIFSMPPVLTVHAAEMPVAEDGLILYTSFDESSINGTTVKDLSGRGNNGTMVGSPALVEGVRGKAITFDNSAVAGKGGQTAQQYVNYGKPSDLQFGTKDFSLSFWMKTANNGSNNGTILGNKDYTSGSNVGLAVGNYNNPSNKDIRVNFSAKSGSRIENKGISANDNAWHHVAATFKRDGDMVVYLDGKEVKRAGMTSQAGLSVDTGLDFILGADGKKFLSMSDCAVDELRIYNKAITPSRVEELYNEIMKDADSDALLQDGLVLCSSFDENSINGTTVNDLSGKGNTGTMVGSPAFVEGVRGKAITFDNSGVAGKDGQTAKQYVNYGKPADLQFGTKDLSLSFWMKTENNGSNSGTILGNKDYKSGSNIGLAVGNYNNASNKDIRVNFSAKSGSRIENKGISANDNAWHHVAATFKRDGDMVVYLDGKEVKRTSMIPQAGLSVDTGLDFILGADGKKFLSMSDCAVDELRVYNKAIDPSVVSLLYASEGAIFELTKMETAVNSLQPGGRYTAEAIDAMKSEITVAKSKLSGLTAGAAAALLADVKEKYEAFLMGTPLMSFHLVSDVHIKEGNLTHARATDFIAGLEDMKEINPNAAAFVTVGDNTSNGTEAQVNSFYEIMGKYNPVPDENTMIALGNHDVRGPNSAEWNKDPNVISPYWPTAYNLYMTNNQKYMPDTAGKTYYDRWLDGYHFIILNTENGIKDSSSLSDEQLSWFENKLAENAKDNKPIFVFVHQALNDTHWRSNILNGFGAEDAKVKAILAKYPQTIMLAGHIHNGLGVVEAIDRKTGTTVEVPSYNESENGDTSTGTGYEVMVYDNEVAFRARNFKTSTWMPEYDITVKTPGLPSLYKKASEKNQSDYTAKSFAPVAAAMTECEKIFNTKYDQSGLTWDKVGPPPAFLFHKETRSKIDDLTNTLSTALDGLVAVEKVKPISASENVYLQAGSDAAKVSSAYSNYTADVLKLKYSDDNKNQNYTRKTLVTFNLDGMTEAPAQTNLSLQLRTPLPSNPNPGPHFIKASVYQISPEWKTGTVTWNSAPAKGGKVAEITSANISGDMVTVDVSSAVTAAVKKGEKAIAFEISIDTQANDNKLEFYSSRATGKKVPSLVPNTEEKPADSEFTVLRQNWRNYLLGGKLDQSNEAVKTYISNLNTKSADLWSTMNKSDKTGRKNLWDSLDMSYIKGTGAAAKEHSSNVAVTFYNLRDLAIAYSTMGCNLYQNPQVKDELIKALDYMVENHYSDSDTKTPVFGNWWHWEIGGPIAFLNTAVILYDDLSPDQIKSYTNAVNRFSPVCDKPSGYPGSPAMTGANLIDKGTAVALSGILTNNSAKLEHIKSAFKTVFQYVQSGDGFYKDGSFIQHQALAYMGGYGAQLYEKLSIFFSVLNGSRWELTYDDHAEQLVFDMVFKGIEPLLYNSRFMDMVSGRDITRKGSFDKERGAEVLDAIILLSDAMPTPELKNRFDSMIKYYVGQDENFFYNNCVHISSIMKANQIMKNPSIRPRSEYVNHQLFASMDKLVHITSNYGFALSMHSSRTYGHELINDEGKRTWNISDGMTYLYNKDTDQYSKGFWATIDPRRMPGTTSEFVMRPNGAGDRTKNIYSWIGGSNLGNYGAAGMHFKTLGSTGSTRNGTDAKKSWFMFGNEIVALGSNITSSTGNTVETIIENRRILPNGSNKVTINGTEANILDNTAVDDGSKGTEFKNPSWMHLEGNTAGSDIGYYFPESTTIKALKESRTGDWVNQGTSTGEEKNSFATFWFNHGAKPTDASYEYVLLPGMNSVQTAAYAKNPSIQVLENSGDAHAVKHTSLDITAVNFWKDQTKTVAGITSNKQASVMVRQTADSVEIGVSDPTQLNNGTIEICLPMAGGTVLSKDNNITVVQAKPFIKLSVSTAGLVGKTSTIKLAKNDSSKKEVIAISDTLTKIEVPVGTPFKQLPLPKKVNVTANDMHSYQVEISWSKGNYDKTCYGLYELKGTLVMPKGLYNSAGLKPVIQVQVGKSNVLALSDTYVQGGTDADKPSHNYALRSELIVKNDGGAQKYTRKSLIKFDLKNAPNDFEHAYLKFQLKDVPSSDFTIANIYEVENNWDENTVTFNSMPKRISDKPAASLTMDAAKTSLKQNFEITAMLKKALAEGRTQISFEISIPTQAKNNYMGIYSIESSVTDDQKPTISWEKTPIPEIVDKSNLDLVAAMPKDLDIGSFIGMDEPKLKAAIAEAEAVLADENASVEDLHEAEDNLLNLILKLRKKPEKTLI